MSFILEALKKSDKKRQDGEIPKLETVHKSTLSGVAKRPKWLWLLLFVLFINAAVLLWLLGPWAPPESLPPIMLATPAAPLETPAVPVTRQQVERLVLVPAPEPAQPETAVAPLKPAEQAASASAVEMPAPTSGEPLPEKLYLPAELPAAVRQNLPVLHMSLHAFNPESAAASLVRINDQIMRVGSRLANRYLLEEITADGAILRYEGYRILVARKQVQGD